MTLGPALKSLLVACSMLLLLTVLYIVPASHRALNDLDLLSLRLRFQLRGAEPPDPALRVLGITENTISEFAKQEIYYPFPRDLHAVALKRLADAGARVVVVDILFSEADSWDSAEDEALRDAVLYCRERGCAVVLAAAIEEISYSQGVSSRSLITPAPVIMEAEPALGMSNTQPKLSYKVSELVQFEMELGPAGEVQQYYSQAVEAFQLFCAQDGRDAAAVLKRAVTVPPSGQAFFRINYCGQPERFEGYAYHYEVLFPGLFDGDPRRTPSAAEVESIRRAFEGSVVFLGSRAKADNDYFDTPYGLMFGVDTNSQAFDTLNRGRNISAAYPITVLLLTWLLGTTAMILAQLRPLLKSVLAATPVFALAVGGNLALYAFSSIDISLTMTSAGFALPYVACAIYGGITEELAKKKIRGTFIRYVSDQVVEQIIEHPDLAGLGGVERTVAVMFNDIRGYSTITERLQPEQIVSFVNTYLGEMADIIRRHGGFVDKYLGDGLMACFGGPVPTENPARDALSAGLEMIAALNAKVNPLLQAQGLPQLKVGIGIHLGPVVMGNFGSEARMDYTLVGDAVNVASRVEGQTKEFGWALIVTRETLQAAGDGFTAELLGERQVKGRQQPVTLYRVFDPAAPERFMYNPPAAGKSEPQPAARLSQD